MEVILQAQRWLAVLSNFLYVDQILFHKSIYELWMIRTTQCLSPYLFTFSLSKWCFKLFILNYQHSNYTVTIPPQPQMSIALQLRLRDWGFDDPDLNFGFAICKLCEHGEYGWASYRISLGLCTSICTIRGG